MNSGYGALCTIATDCINVGSVMVAVVFNVLNKGYSLVMPDKYNKRPLHDNAA